MPKRTTMNRHTLSPAALRRAETLDALHDIFPFDRRDQLATLLTDEDVATLKHLIDTGVGANSMRALASDLGYLQAWSLAATGMPLPWPAPEHLLLTFVAHHIWDPAERLTDPEHGMPAEIMGTLLDKRLLRAPGPHSRATVRRRLMSWATLTKSRGLAGHFSCPAVKAALGKAARGNPREGRDSSADLMTGDVFAQLLATCDGDHLVDIRDRALLMLVAGGSRRSEVASLRIEDLIVEDGTPSEPSDPASPPVPTLTIRLALTPSSPAKQRLAAEDEQHTVLVGAPAAALQAWIARADISSGAVFRKIDRWDNVSRRVLTPQSVNLIVKSRAEKAGLDPKHFSAHGLRSVHRTAAATGEVPAIAAGRGPQTVDRHRLRPPNAPK